MMKTKLKPCPFCGSNDIEIFETDSGIAGLSGEYYAFCNNCFASASQEDTRLKAKKAWNRRPKKEKEQ